MKLKYLFNTNAVLLNEDNPKEVLDTHTFEFLNHQIAWETKNEGIDIVLDTNINNQDYAKGLEIMLKFASIITYRQSHIKNFEYVTSANAEISQIHSQAGIETRFILKGNETSFSPKLWSMLSFYLEYKNSSSTFYKFICLYKIVEIQNLKPKIISRKTILIEKPDLTKKYLDLEIPKQLTDQGLTKLKQSIFARKTKQKSIGEYFKHLFRDAFSHTGFLENNDYKYGYPTLNPFDLNDEKRYRQAIIIFEQLAKKIMRANEPKVN